MLLTQIIQEIQDTMRRPNLRIAGIKESEDSQNEGPINIFNKIIEENFPNLKKEMFMNISEAHSTPKRLYQSSCNKIIKTPNALTKKNIESSKANGQVTYKHRPFRIAQDFSSEMIKARRSWADLI